MSLLELFCDVDDFLLRFESQWKASQLQEGSQRERAGQLYPSDRVRASCPSHLSCRRPMYWNVGLDFAVTSNGMLILSLA